LRGQALSSKAESKRGAPGLSVGTMEYVNMGRTGLRVSRLPLGLC